MTRPSGDQAGPEALTLGSSTIAIGMAAPSMLSAPTVYSAIRLGPSKPGTTRVNTSVRPSGDQAGSWSKLASGGTVTARPVSPFAPATQMACGRDPSEQTYAILWPSGLHAGCAS